MPSKQALLYVQIFQLFHNPNQTSFLDGEGTVYDFAGTLVNANYDEVIVATETMQRAFETTPLHSAKKRFNA